MANEQKDFRQALIDALTMVKKRELANHAPFKARAYQTVIQQLEHRTEPIYSMEQVTSLKGVGEKIREKMEEIFQTGQLRVAEEIKENDDMRAYDELQAVYGIGPKKARDLIQQGIRSVSDLRQEEKNSGILNEKQWIGVHYYEELLQRIPREEMDQHDAFLRQHISLSLELVGSYRRGLTSSGDIDVLLRVPEGQTPKDIQDAFYRDVQRLVDSDYIEEILAIGPHKCMAICRLKGTDGKGTDGKGTDGKGTARRLDLLVTPDVEYAYSLLYFTGSDRFNVAFRQHALTKGYTLNEHCLTAIQEDRPLPPYMKTEQDIFHFLGLQYTPPQERVDSSSLLEKSIKRTTRRPVVAKKV